MDGNLLIDTFIERAGNELPKYFWRVEDDRANQEVIVLYRDKPTAIILYDEIWFSIASALDSLAETVRQVMEERNG